jgi:hypothetical protein
VLHKKKKESFTRPNLINLVSDKCSLEMLIIVGVAGHSMSTSLISLSRQAPCLGSIIIAR